MDKKQESTVEAGMSVNTPFHGQLIELFVEARALDRR